MSSASHDSPASESPYADLGPDTVLDALDAVGLRGDGRLIQLNSYENRVFQVYLEDGRIVVAKFYRPGRWSDAQIIEEHTFAAELATHEIPVAAPLALVPDAASGHAGRIARCGETLACWTSERGAAYRFGVTDKLAGRAPELEDPAALEWIGRFIGRLHAVGATAPFRHRQTLDIATFGTDARDWLIDHGSVPPEALDPWRSSVDAALDAVARAFESAGGARPIRLHGDCHPGNILWAGDGPHFVDLDDAVTGPAIQDLWMLLSGDRASMTRQLAAVLDGYEAFMDFDWRETRLIEALRTLRIVHHSAWIARRWNDPAFPIAFPWFASPGYWNDQARRLHEQIEAMAQPPLGGG